MLSVDGNVVDVINRRIFAGRVIVHDSRIIEIEKLNKTVRGYILPGLIDAHVHIESSMLPPSEFARLASVHGTVGTVSDPHEIANVLGVKGVNLMIENGRLVPFKFYFGAPSCVPATNFETSGSMLDSSDIEELLSRNDIHYLSEMMNFPGVIFNDNEVMKKLAIASKYSKPVDGHAPALTRKELESYVNSGISTDHECFSLDEAIEKISLGMKILIREGSAAKNYSALNSLINSHPEMVMFCSDDKHPNDLVYGHINLLIKRAIQDGYDLFDILRAATYNPVTHYSLDVGLLGIGDDADFIIIDNFEDFNILKTYIKGSLIAKNGKTLLNHIVIPSINVFEADFINVNDIKIKPSGSKVRVIEAYDSELITGEYYHHIDNTLENLESDIENDILKLVVINRYQKSKPAIGFIKNFGLKNGAIASSVAHDSHNIIAVGSNDKFLVEAINAVISSKGGMSAAGKLTLECLPLPLAGIMSNLDGYSVAEQYKKLNQTAKSFGCNLSAPFMTLSFMSLLVIPTLKLSDKGLFDGRSFQFTNLFLE